MVKHIAMALIIAALGIGSISMVSADEGGDGDRWGGEHGGEVIVSR